MNESTLAEQVIKITKGMANATRSDWKCSSCEIKVPKYPRRYPKSCLNCGNSLKQDTLSIGLGV